MTEKEQALRGALKVNALYLHRLLKTRKKLLERLKRITSNTEGGVVLDPFMGTGSKD